MGKLYNSDVSNYDYIIIRAGTPELLEKRVKEAFKKEYNCLGGPFLDHNTFLYQAMEKFES